MNGWKDLKIKMQIFFDKQEIITQREIISCSLIYCN